MTLPRELPVTAGRFRQLAPTVPAAPDGRRACSIVDDDESHAQAACVRAGALRPQDPRGGRRGRGPRVARPEKPDAILLDVFMPRLDGWATLRALKEFRGRARSRSSIHSVVENRAFGFSLGAYRLPHQARAARARPRGPLPGGRARLRGATSSSSTTTRTCARCSRASSRPRGTARVAAEGGARRSTRSSGERPSAVLLDLMMPQPDGFEVLYRIREDPSCAACRSSS